MANFVRFLDAVDLKPLKIPKEVADFYANMDQQNVRPLRVRIAATHSGKVTRNNGFYLPYKMQEGAHTFTAQYPKPIQVHHEDRVDPIGRSTEANYIDTSRGFRDSVKDSVLVNDGLVKLLDGSLDFKDASEFVIQHFLKDASINTDPDYEGLGYIELVADIIDPAAIQKILDGRYLTGSVGATTNKAMCSVCKKDWAAEGKCKHRPGKIYDETKCVLIAGDLSYEEYSFVNRPADRHSRVIEINVNGIQDFVTIDENQIDDIFEISLVIDQSRSQEDKNMLFKDALELARKDEKLTKLEGLEDKVKSMVDTMEDATEESFIKAMVDKYTEAEEVIVDEDSVKTFWADEYDEIVGDDEWGKDYAKMMAEEEFRDAKLSATDRKKLPDSVFSGPGRSFPVNDCAHYTAALRFVDTCDSEDKDKIKACIERKGKRLNCGAKKEDSSEESTSQFDPANFDHLEDEEIVQMFDALEKVFVERDMETTCKADELTAKIETLTDELEKTKENIDSSSKKRLEAARSEIHYLHSDIEYLTKDMANAIEELREVYIQRVKDLTVLAGESLDSLELDDKNNAELKSLIKELESKVDMEKITDTLNSGLSNSPTKKVADPTIISDKKKVSKDTDGTKKMDPAIRLQWLQIRKDFGEEVADKFIEDCKENGVIPKDD